MAPALLFRSTGLDLLRHLKVSVLIYRHTQLLFRNRKRLQAVSLGFVCSARAKGREIMPLVRIDLRKGKDLTYRQEIGRVVTDVVESPART